jgi:hypothetical protein
MKREQYTIPRQFQSGEHMTPTPKRDDGVAILKPFYKGLEDEVFANLRTWDIGIPIVRTRLESVSKSRQETR